MAVFADPDEKTAKVVVPDYQLSLAIGKEGQNARLAARLTGYKIDIKSETQAKDTPGFRYEDYMYDEEEEYDEDGSYDSDEYSDEEGAYEDGADSGYEEADTEQTDGGYEDADAEQADDGYEDADAEQADGGYEEADAEQADGGYEDADTELTDGDYAETGDDAVEDPGQEAYGDDFSGEESEEPEDVYEE